MSHDVFVTGGSGYLGRPLIEGLLARGHHVHALVRSGSEARVPSGAQVVVGNALDSSGWRDRVAPADTFVHLVGTPHPSPAKAAQFQAVDLPSIEASVEAAAAADPSLHLRQRRPPRADHARVVLVPQEI